MIARDFGESALSELSQLCLLFSESKLSVKIENLSDSELLVTFSVRARPGAKLSKIQFSESGELLVWVQAKPQDGAANAAICEAIAKGFGVSKSSVSLEKGARGKEKRFTVCFERKDNKPESFYIEKLRALLESN